MRTRDCACWTDPRIMTRFNEQRQRCSCYACGMQLQLVPADGPDDMANDQLGAAGSAAASSDSGSDEFRRGLMPATLMPCVKSQ